MNILRLSDTIEKIEEFLINFAEQNKSNMLFWMIVFFGGIAITLWVLKVLAKKNR